MGLVYVRSFLSQIVYSRIYNRNINEHWFFMAWLQASLRGEKFFFIDCAYENVKKRFIEHDEKDLDIKDWQNHKSIFYDVIKKAEENYKIKLDTIDTTVDTIKQSANKIMEKL
jgi:hypothetical protein